LPQDYSGLISEMFLKVSGVKIYTEQVRFSQSRLIKGPLNCLNSGYALIFAKAAEFTSNQGVDSIGQQVCGLINQSPELPLLTPAPETCSGDIY
jgi:hypothetical protein